MKWLSIQYRKEFLEYASSADNGTWNKTGFFNNITFDIPSYDEQLKLVKLYERAEKIKIRLEKVFSIYNSLLSKEIE